MGRLRLSDKPHDWLASEPERLRKVLVEPVTKDTRDPSFMAVISPAAESSLPRG